MLQDQRITNENLLPGQVFGICHQQQYTRSDQTLFSVDERQPAIACILYNGQSISVEDFLKQPTNTQAEVAAFSYEGGVVGNMRHTLYPIILEHQTGASFIVEYCHQHGNEQQFSFKKFGQSERRHAYQTYSAQTVTSFIKKREGSTVIYTKPQETLLKLQSQENLGSGEKNRPSCTLYNCDAANFPPPGWRIVQQQGDCVIS